MSCESGERKLTDLKEGTIIKLLQGNFERIKNHTFKIKMKKSKDFNAVKAEDVVSGSSYIFSMERIEGRGFVVIKEA